MIFLLGSFVVGASATILQVVINPYLTACHVKATQSIQRLAIGGSANSVGNGGCQPTSRLAMAPRMAAMTAGSFSRSK